MRHYVQAVTIRWFNASAYYAVTLAQALAKCGHRVTLVVGGDTPSVAVARERGIDVVAGSGSNSRNPFGFMSDIRKFRMFVRESDITLVNAHTGYDHLMWALALRGTGIPLVMSSGNQIPPKVHPGSRFLMKKTAGFITSCTTVQGYYADGFGIEPSKIHVIPGGVDSVFFSPDYPRNRLRPSLGIPENAFVFGIIGRYSPVKGHHHFFRAAGMVASKYPDAWFLVSGWNAQLREDDIRLMAAQAGVIDRTCFPGLNHDIRNLIGTLDAGVIASTGSETICRIAMEYMAMGISVIGTDTNVIPEIVRHGESGIIVPAGDHDAMESAMERLITSDDRGKAMGQRGREIIEADYSLESFASITLDAYRSMTGDG